MAVLLLHITGLPMAKVLEFRLTNGKAMIGMRSVIGNLPDCDLLTMIGMSSGLPMAKVLEFRLTNG